jgi:sugar/nucleoside kinase (ribokinase family)
MQALTRPEPIDYLVIGHISKDLTSSGPKMGGTAAYAALTALALGVRVGVVTSWGEELPIGNMRHVAIVNLPTKQSTTFENLYQPTGRSQVLHSTAQEIPIGAIPNLWKSTPIIHLGPIAQEIDPHVASQFPNSLLGITPQGWMRDWDEQGVVHKKNLINQSILQNAAVTIISMEDIDENEDKLEELVHASSIFVATEGAKGARVFWNGDVRRVHAPQVEEIDATGAGDIFAAAFFIQYHKTRDPWEAARFANQLAAHSVTRIGLASVPTPTEIQHAIVEVL